MLYPKVLTSLTPREAIADALHRAIIGWDRYEISIFNSAFAGEDVTIQLGTRDDKHVIHGLSNIRTQLLDNVGPMDTTHMVTNIRVDVAEGADTAFLTSYVLAQHCPPGRGKEPSAPKYLVAGEYWIDLVKDNTDGLWKIKKWVLDAIWKEGDATIMRKLS